MTVRSKGQAQRLVRKLNAIDARIFQEWLNGPREDRLDGLDTEKTNVVKQAMNAGLKLVSIQVADGYALYYEARRTKTSVTFQWLYSPDDYESSFGRTVSVPIKTADKLIGHFNPKHL